MTKTKQGFGSARVQKRRFALEIKQGEEALGWVQISVPKCYSAKLEKQVALLWSWILIENPSMARVKAIDTIFIFSGNRECKAVDMPWVISRIPEVVDETYTMEPADIPQQLLDLIKLSRIEEIELEDDVEVVEIETNAA